MWKEKKLTDFLTIIYIPCESDIKTFLKFSINKQPAHRTH